MGILPFDSFSSRLVWYSTMPGTENSAQAVYEKSEAGVQAPGKCFTDG